MMVKKVAVFLLFGCCGLVQADWKLDFLDYQESDLVVDYAWRYNKTGKLVQLNVINDYIKKSSKKKLVMDYQVNSRGIALRVHDTSGTEFDLFMDGQASHSVEWKRAKTKSIADFGSSCTIKDGQLCARCMIQEVKSSNKTQSAFMGYDELKPGVLQEFNVRILGKGGNYSLKLEKVE